MLRVRDVMTRDVVTLGPEASAREALGICRERGIRHIPIVEKDRLVGLVSDRDLRDVSPPRQGSDQATLSWTRVRDIMSTDLSTVGPLDTIDHVAQEIYDRKIGCLPVVDDGEVVGIITSQDMMRAMIELTGANVRGSWIEVEVPNEPGALAEITDAIR
ncbi:MAG: CBS and ACT domain-containing protein, partial [Rubrobacteraceae bacterium]